MKKIAVALMLVGCGSDGHSASTPGTGGAEPISDSGAPTGSGGVDDAGQEISGGAPGAGGAKSSGGSSMGGSATCIPATEECTNDANGCCNGSTCITLAGDTSGKAFCAANCLVNTDCQSLCCTKLVNAAAATCSPAAQCAACITAGHSCLGAETACCAGSTCVATATDTTCAAICTTNSQCSSGCCAPLTNSNIMVCSPVSFCR